MLGGSVSLAIQQLVYAVTCIMYVYVSYHYSFRKWITLCRIDANDPTCLTITQLATVCYLQVR